MGAVNKEDGTLKWKMLVWEADETPLTSHEKWKMEMKMKSGQPVGKWKSRSHFPSPPTLVLTPEPSLYVTIMTTKAKNESTNEWVYTRSRVACLDAITGVEKWSYATSESAPSNSYDEEFVGSPLPSRDGDFVVV